MFAILVLPIFRAFVVGVLTCHRNPKQIYCSEFLMAWECLRHVRLSPTRPPLSSRFSVPHQLCQNHPPQWLYQVKASHVLRVQIHVTHLLLASRLASQSAKPRYGWPGPMYYTCRAHAPKPVWLAHTVQLLPEVVVWSHPNRNVLLIDVGRCLLNANGGLWRPIGVYTLCWSITYAYSISIL